MVYKRRKSIYFWLAILAIIILFININTLLIYTHKITPVGERLLTTKQIQKDIAYMFKDKYKIEYEVDTFMIKNIIPLKTGRDKEVLEKAITNEDDLLIEISLTDKRIRSRSLDVNKELQEIVTNQATRFLIYFIQREYDPSIKVLNATYAPRNFDLDAINQAHTYIIIEEFKDEYERLKSEGFKGRELESKLEEKFINYY